MSLRRKSQFLILRSPQSGRLEGCRPRTVPHGSPGDAKHRPETRFALLTMRDLRHIMTEYRCPMTTPQLETRYVFTITVRIGEVTSAGEIGTGVRRIIPIIGGVVKGEGVNGKVCPFGADFQIIRPNELIELEAKYAFETDDGAVVYVENKGLRFGPVDLLQKLKRGEPVDPNLIYFRTVPRFETGAAKYRWLMENLFIGSAARHADRVVIDVHQVL